MAAVQYRFSLQCIPTYCYGCLSIMQVILERLAELDRIET